MIERTVSKLGLEPKVAVLLAVYQGSRFIAEQIRSIHEQTYANWVLILCDDGADDDAESSVDPFVIEGRVVRIGKGVRQRGAVRNFSGLLGWALENTDAEIFLFSDQDDVWLPRKIEAAVRRLQEMSASEPAGTPLLVHTDLVVVDEHLVTISRSLSDYQGMSDPAATDLPVLLAQNHITGCAAAFNRRLADLAYPIPEDAVWHDWWVGLLAATTGKIAYEPEPLVRYRQTGANVVGARRHSCRQEFDFGRGLKAAGARAEYYMRTSRQAHALLQRLRERVVRIDKKRRVLVYAYSTYFERPRMARLLLWVRYRFGRRGWLGKLKFVLGTIL